MAGTESDEFVSGELFLNPKTKENVVNNNRSGKFWYGGAARNIARGLLVALAALAVSGIASAQDVPALVKFKGGIGVITVTGVNAANGTVNLNVVRNVNPGAPWRIADLEADVGSDGHIRAKGRGLLLANGNGIGTNAGASVFATLFCGPAATASDHSSNRVALEADGDFRIDDFLSPAPPTPCDNPVLLIRNGAGAGVWFAAGISKQEEEDH
jgi:hypothetical protein